MANKKDTYVIVTVDTCGINEGNKNELVTFSDNRGDIPGTGPKFLSKVDMGKRITWIGNVNNPGENCKEQENFYENNSVEIKQILRKDIEGNPHILKKDYYYDVNNNGVVVGKIKNEEIQGEESYDITILVNGKDWYTIDPQMQMTK